MTDTGQWHHFQKKASDLADRLAELEGRLQRLRDRLSRRWAEAASSLPREEWARQYHPKMWNQIQNLEARRAQRVRESSQLALPDHDKLQNVPLEQERSIVQSWVQSQRSPRRVEKLLSSPYAGQAARYVHAPDPTFLEAVFQAGAARELAENDHLTPDLAQRVACHGLELVEATNPIEEQEKGWEVLTTLRSRRFSLDQKLWEQAARQWIDLPEIEQQNRYVELFSVPVLGKLLEECRDDPITINYLFQKLLGHIYYPRHHAVWRQAISLCSEPQKIPGLLGISQELLADPQIREEMLDTTRETSAHERVLVGFLQGRAGQLPDSQVRRFFRQLGQAHPRRALLLLEHDHPKFNSTPLQASDFSVLLADTQDPAFRRKVLRKMGELDATNGQYRRRPT